MNDRLLMPNPDWAMLPLFDRKGWKRVRFGDVVENLNETERNPAGAGIERFIAMEHLEPGSLHIREWGNVADGTTFNRRCRPGQVLFGKRRAYQRKVAVAEFDAVVSGDIYVFAPKGDRLLPELLPFLCISERFFDFAVETSAGSLSPRTNWSSLASFEFDLPPLEQQRRIAEMLWAVDGAIQASMRQGSALATLKRTAIDERTVFRKGSKRKYPTRVLDEVIALCQYGLSCPLSEKGSYPILRMMNYDEELVAITDLKYADVPAQTAKEFTVQRGDILFNRTNSADLVGKVGIFDLDGEYLFASYLVRLKANPKIMMATFLNFFLNSDTGQRAIRAFVTPGVSQANVSAGNLRKVRVPVPSLEEQKEVVQELSVIATLRRSALKQLESQEKLLNAMENVIFNR